MKIAPITTNYITRNNNVKFTGEYTYKDISEAKSKGLNVGLPFGGFIGMVLGILVGCGLNIFENKQFSEKYDKVINSEDIQKDTFTVKDITGDEKPDLILYQKDGSKIVIDIANQNILQEKNTLESY